jgi:hypothetical protein
MARTLAAAPTDRSMWRRLLRIVHPDTGGDEDLFIWTRNVQEHVCGSEPVYETPRYQPRPAPHYSPSEARIDYTEAFEKAQNFDDLTRQARLLANHVPEVYARLLRLLSDCYAAYEYEGAAYKMQHQGATYKSLAAVAHRAGMSKEERIRWYRICESIPLSQRHAGHIIGGLQRAAA